MTLRLTIKYTGLGYISFGRVLAQQAQSPKFSTGTIYSRWWHKPLIPALSEQRYQNKVLLDYSSSSRKKIQKSTHLAQYEGLEKVSVEQNGEPRYRWKQIQIDKTSLTKKQSQVHRGTWYWYISSSSAKIEIQLQTIYS